MRVLVSVVGRFHAFDLAKQLNDYNVLFKLNSTYPKKISARWVKNADINGNIWLEFLRRYIKPYLPNKYKDLLNIHISSKHAKSNIKYLDKVDVFIGWSGSSLETLIAAKNKNVITILERGSSHYNYQMKILDQEFTKHNKFFKPDFKIWQRELLEYELADYISVPSKYVYNSFIENGIPRNKLILNNYGVDLSSFKQIEKKDDVFRIIYAGGFTIRKGVTYLLKAFTELDLPNSEFIHLGSISDETIELRKKYSSAKIKYLGHQKQSDLYKYYSQGSVFVMMSLEEGMAMVQLQAMACGLPLICSENSGGEDLISSQSEEGFVIPIRDVNMLKQKILYLYDNPKALNLMSKKAKSKVSNGYSWDDYGDRYVENLNNIINLKGSKC